MIYQKLKVTLASPVTALAVLLVVDLAVAGCSTGRTGGSRLATPPDPPPVVVGGLPVVPEQILGGQGSLPARAAAPAAAAGTIRGGGFGRDEVPDDGGREGQGPALEEAEPLPPRGAGHGEVGVGGCARLQGGVFLGCNNI